MPFNRRHTGAEDFDKRHDGLGEQEVQPTITMQVDIPQANFLTLDGVDNLPLSYLVTYDIPIAPVPISNLTKRRMRDVLPITYMRATRAQDTVPFASLTTSLPLQYLVPISNFGHYTIQDDITLSTLTAPSLTSPVPISWFGESLVQLTGDIPISVMRTDSLQHNIVLSNIAAAKVLHNLLSTHLKGTSYTADVSVAWESLASLVTLNVEIIFSSLKGTKTKDNINIAFTKSLALETPLPLFYEGFSDAVYSAIVRDAVLYLAVRVREPIIKGGSYEL